MLTTGVLIKNRLPLKDLARSNVGPDPSPQLSYGGYQQGFLLPMALLVVVGIASLAVWMPRHSTTLTDFFLLSYFADQSHYAAETGAQLGLNQLLWPAASRQVRERRCQSLSSTLALNDAVQAPGLEQCVIKVACTTGVLIKNRLPLKTRGEYPPGPANHYKWLALQQAQSGALQTPVSAPIRLPSRDGGYTKNAGAIFVRSPASDGFQRQPILLKDFVSTDAISANRPPYHKAGKPEKSIAAPVAYYRITSDAQCGTGVFFGRHSAVLLSPK